MTRENRFDVSDLEGVVLDGRYELGALEDAERLVFSGAHVDGAPVQVRLVRPTAKDREAQIQRIVAGSRALLALEHPNIAAVRDVGVMEPGLVYLVMDRLEGTDLHAVLRREGPLPWPRALEIATQVVAGLAAAQAHGVLHRDLNPRSVFVVCTSSPGDLVKLIDFGLAAYGADGRAPTITGSMQVVGEAAYLAPEVARGGKADARSEIYAVGVLMYEMTTGTVPFRGSNTLDVLAKAISNPLPAPRARTPDLPEEADLIIRRCLAKRPAQRPADMAALERELLQLAGSEADARRGDLHIESPRETTQVAPAPRAPMASVAAVSLPPPIVPRAERSRSTPLDDALQATLSEVRDLGVDVETIGADLMAEPEPELPSPQLLLEPDEADATGPVMQTGTVVAPAPGPPPLERQSMPSIPVEVGGSHLQAERESDPSAPRRGTPWLLWFLIPPVLAAGCVAMVWLRHGEPRLEQGVAPAAVASTVVDPLPRVSTWDEGFRATPEPDPPQVMAPDEFTPPAIRRPDPEDLPPPEVAPEPEHERSDPAAPVPRRKSTPRPRPRTSRPVAPTRRPPPPPPPPKVPNGSGATKPKPAAGAKKDGSGQEPWKRVPVPSDNW